MADPTQSLDALVVAEFGGELRRFRLTVPLLEKVERDCDAGPAVIAGELARGAQLLEMRAEGKVTLLQMMAHGLGNWRASYIKQTIFWGLQGGGMAPNEAGRLCREFIDERGFMGLLENIGLAFGVVTGAYQGPEDDQVGESEGAAGTAPETAES